MDFADPFNRITVEPGKCAGKPCIRGMRITVRRVLELLATYPDRNAILLEYPYLEDEDLQQALRYAAATVDETIKHGSVFQTCANCCIHDVCRTG